MPISGAKEIYDVEAYCKDSISHPENDPEPCSPVAADCDVRDQHTDHADVNTVRALGGNRLILLKFIGASS